MADSLRDQLLKSGLVHKLKAEAVATRPAERKPPRGSKPARDGAQAPKPRPPQPPRARTPAEIDLAKAYALRDRAEREQREADKRAAEAKAREKAERKQKMATLLADKALNLAEAEVPRHFPHGDKIRRVYCSPDQLVKINAGELAVVQHLGRYLIVDREIGEQVRAINADAFVLLCDPDAPAEDDIPADLIW